jgi:hypothetical protein
VTSFPSKSADVLDNEMLYSSNLNRMQKVNNPESMNKAILKSPLPPIEEYNPEFKVKKVVSKSKKPTVFAQKGLNDKDLEYKVNLKKPKDETPLILENSDFEDDLDIDNNLF